MVVVGQRAGPEAALRVACAVVHPRPGRGHLGERAQAAVRAQVGEAPPGGEQPALVALDGRDRTDGPGDLVGAHRDESAAVGDPVAVDAPGQDVDPQQLSTARVPPGALPEQGLLGRAGEGGAGRARLAGATGQARVHRKTLRLTPS